MIASVVRKQSVQSAVKCLVTRGPADVRRSKLVAKSHINATTAYQRVMNAVKHRVNVIHHLALPPASSAARPVPATKEMTRIAVLPENQR